MASSCVWCRTSCCGRRRVCKPLARAGGRSPTRRARAAEVLLAAGKAGQKTLDVAQSRTLLEAYGLAVPADALASTPEQAVAAARRIGWPVAMKLASPDILHKTDVGGVLLGVQAENALRAGFETIMCH